MAKRSIEIILEGRNETRSPFSDARAEMKRWEAEVQRTSRNVRAASKAGDEGNAAGQAAAMAAAQERAATLRQTADHRKALADRLAAYKQHKAAEAATRSQALAAAAAAERAATAREAQAGRAALADRLAEFKRAKAMERTLAELHAQEMTASAVKTANATAGPAAAATAQTSRLMRTLIGGSGSAEAKINGVKYALQGLVGAVPGLDMVATSISGMGLAAGGVIAATVLVGRFLRAQSEAAEKLRSRLQDLTEETRRYRKVLLGMPLTTTHGSELEGLREEAAEKLNAAQRELDEYQQEGNRRQKDDLSARGVVSSKEAELRKAVGAARVELERLDELVNEERRIAAKQVDRRLADELEQARIDAIADENHRRRAAMALRHAQERRQWEEAEQAQAGSGGDWDLAQQRQRQEAANLEAEIDRAAARESDRLAREKAEREDRIARANADNLHNLRMLQTRGIADELERETKLIELEYARRIEIAREAGHDIALLERARDEEIAQSRGAIEQRRAAAAAAEESREARQAEREEAARPRGPVSIAAVERGFLTRAPGHYDPYGESLRQQQRIGENTAAAARAAQEALKVLATIAAGVGLKPLVARF